MLDHSSNDDRSPIDRFQIDRFLIEQIDSVPHLEALLLLWRNAPHSSTSAQLAEQLYIAPAEGSAIAEDLHRRGLIARQSHSAFFYDTQNDDRNRLIEALDTTYRRDLIRISGIIHSKASPGIRAFADAFRFRKDKA